MTNNREILFRGFHPCEDGGMTIYVEGKAVVGRWAESSSRIANYGAAENATKKSYEHVFLIRSLLDGFEYMEDEIAHVDMPVFEVIPSTVCQYTGLNDKNGRKIFEGDCIEHYATSGTVIFDDGMFCLGMSSKIQFGKYRQPLCYIGTDYCEVIGTIFDKLNEPEVTPPKCSPISRRSEQSDN